MFDVKLKYDLDPTSNTVKVGVTPGSILKITLQSLFWSFAPIVALVAVGEAIDKFNNVNRKSAK